MERCVRSELDPEALRWIIDVARSTTPAQMLLDSINQVLVLRDDEYISPGWTKGLNFKKELCELILDKFDEMVTEYPSGD